MLITFKGYHRWRVGQAFWRKNTRILEHEKQLFLVHEFEVKKMAIIGEIRFVCEVGFLVQSKI